jgi:hypothetical protein
LLTVDVNGIQCTAASVTATATISGFRPTNYSAPLAVLTTNTTGTPADQWRPSRRYQYRHDQRSLLRTRRHGHDLFAIHCA